MSTGRVTGRNNHAGDLAPLTSPYGREMFANAGKLIDQPSPIGRQSSTAMGGTVGGMTTRSANVRALFAPSGYFGDAPLSLQPNIEASDPWNRP